MCSGAAVLLVLAALSAPSYGADHASWPSWRGPLGTGEALSADPPLTWSESENIRFRVEIPGKGTSTPIVWGDAVFVLSAVPVPGAEAQPPEGEAQPPEGGAAPSDPPRGEGRGGRGGGRGRGSAPPTVPQQFTVFAIDRHTGAILWQHVAHEGVPHEGTHGDGSWASASALTDGEVVIAHFGSNGLFAYDLSGKPLWHKQLGKMKTRNGFGEGASPALHEKTVIVQWDHEGDSFIVALDRDTGRERWRKERDEITSWATPVVVEVDGRAQVITNATGRIRAYDVRDGAVIWECAGMTTNAIPTPVYADGMVYVTSGFRGAALVAIELTGAKGDITGTDKVKWTFDKDTPYVPSPLLHDGLLYLLKVNTGILSVFDVATGERVLGPQRLESVANVYASPVAAKGRVYLFGRDGDCEVLQHGAEYEVLATNHLDDGFDASPALVGDAIYLRGRKHLYCVAESPEAGQ